MSLKADPKIRKDGRCAQCRKPVHIKARPGVNPALYVDPFCSSSCARAWHGTEVSAMSQTGRPGGYYSDLREND